MNAKQLVRYHRNSNEDIGDIDEVWCERKGMNVGSSCDEYGQVLALSGRRLIVAVFESCRVWKIRWAHVVV